MVRRKLSKACKNFLHGYDALEDEFVQAPWNSPEDRAYMLELQEEFRHKFGLTLIDARCIDRFGYRPKSHFLVGYGGA